MSTPLCAGLCTSLQKIFPDTAPAFFEPLCFSMLQNERKSFQLAVQAKKGDAVELALSGPLAGFVRASCVRLVPAGLTAPKWADGFYLDKKRKAYPDLLLPLDGDAFAAEYNGWNAVWFELSGELPAGRHTLTVTVRANGAETDLQANIEVLPVKLPQQTLIYTNWFHTDCLMRYYNTEAFSETYWRITEAFLKTACDYGMNCVLTPLFTPPLDTKVGGERPTVQLVDVTVTGKDSYAFGFEKLEKWVEMAKRCGVRYFEMSHFFTQWGAKHAPKIMAEKDGETVKLFGWETKASGKEYMRFLRALAPALIEEIDRLGIRDRCLFHVSDEPNRSMTRSYKKAAKPVHELFGDFKIVDALSEYKLYAKGLIETPIPANDHVQKFIGRVPELWTYYCCSQAAHNVSNRFFAMPSMRNRVLGLQLYKFGVKGFLHWGYNFYFSQYSIREIDPFAVTDAGGAFSSGDSFVVYPGKDGTPLLSLRLPVFMDGLQDMRALQLLESLAGREKALAVLEEGLTKPLTFRDYPHEDEWLLDVRERVNRAISEYAGKAAKEEG